MLRHRVQAGRTGGAESGERGGERGPVGAARPGGGVWNTQSPLISWTNTCRPGDSDPVSADASDGAAWHANRSSEKSRAA